MLSWSLSCYPQSILNIRRRSTVGANPSLPTINTLGFFAYFTSTTAMYFSPLIRAQYAARNPASPVPTVRANDVAFAGHALIMCFVLLSMFSKPIWGFEQAAVESGWRIGKGIMGVMVGCVVGVAWMVGVVLVKGRDGGRDPDGFAWIDVVSFAAGVGFKLSKYETCGIVRPSPRISRPRHQYARSPGHLTRPHRHIMSIFRVVVHLADFFQTLPNPGLCHWIGQISHHDGQIYSSSHDKLPPAVNRGLEHRPDSDGHRWGGIIGIATRH